MASKYLEEFVPLENIGVSSAVRDEKPVPRKPDDLFVTVKSTRKVLVVVTAIVIVIIVVGTLIGTVMALLKNGDDGDPRNGTQSALQGKGVEEEEGSSHSSLLLGTTKKTSPSEPPLLVVEKTSSSSKIASLSSRDSVGVHTTKESAPPSIIRSPSTAGTITKISPSTEILSTFSTHHLKVTTTFSSEMLSVSSACSTCDDVSTVLSPSLDNAIDAHTTTISSLSSVMQLVPNTGTITKISPSTEILSTFSTHHLEETMTFSTEMLSVSSACSTCDDVSTVLSPSLDNAIDAHTTTISSLSSVMQLVPNTVAKWSRWSPWSECTKTCGNGTRVRSRVCVAQDPTAVFAPISCAGKAQQNKTCSEWNCPDCLKTCIKGTLNNACDACTCGNHILTGRVQTKSGAPISEAKVTLSETPYKVLGQTDDKGFFKAFNVCTDANQELLITREGFVPVKLKATVLTSTTADVNAQLENSVPPSITVHPQSKMRISGDSVKLCCDGEGNPPPEFEWFKDNNIIDKAIYYYDKNLEISNVSGLSGKYRCRVVNDYGSEFSDVADLIVFNTSEAASCNPTPTSKNATLPAGCVIHGTTNNIVDVGECEPTRCLRNDSAFSNKTCEDQKFCCTVVEVTDVTASCGSSVTFSVPKVARCGCQKCEEPKTQITGVVVGRNGMTEKPIAYCVLKFESFSYRADGNGFFSFEVYDGKQRLSVMFKDSFVAQYADLTKVFHIEKGQTLFSKVVLKPKPAPRPFNSSEDFQVQLGDNGGDSAFAEMEIPKDALLNDDGTTFTGQANLRLNVMDPRNLSDVLTAPADFSTIDEEGEEQMLVSYGMLSFDFEDGSGNKLSPSKPIKIYLDPERMNISVDVNGKTRTKLWWLDTKTGRWIEAGDILVGKKASNRTKRAPTRFLLETEITPAISRQGTFNIDVRENFGAVRVTGSVGSTIRILCEEPNSTPTTYTGYLEGTINQVQVTCISVWINRRCFMQGESANSRFLRPSPPDNFPPSVSATIVSNQNLQGSSNSPQQGVQSFRFEVRTTSGGPIFPHYDNDVQQCRAPILTAELRQFEFQAPVATRLNLASNRIDDFTHPLNWYPSDVNCFIKLLLHGSAAIFLASSHKENKGDKFGDSAAMAEPSDSANVFVTCLEIRCPGLVFQQGVGPVREWTHVLVTHLTGTCDFQSHHLRKQDDIDNRGTRCPTRSKRHSPGSETWLCVPLPNNGFDIDNVYTADKSRSGLGEGRCRNGNKAWQLGMADETNINGPTVEFSCS